MTHEQVLKLRKNVEIMSPQVRAIEFRRALELCLAVSEVPEPIVMQELVQLWRGNVEAQEADRRFDVTRRGRP
jgi:hypothetical protein